jgi:hypothetical protein
VQLVHPSDVDDPELMSESARKGAFLAYFFGAKN